MNVKKLLASHYSLSWRIMNAERDIEQMREMATAIGSFDYTRTPVKNTPRQGAKYESIIERLADKQAKLRGDIEKWMVQRDQVEALIDGIDNERQRNVMYMRYCLYMRYEQIAKETHYSVDHVYALHRKALRMLTVNNS